MTMITKTFLSISLFVLATVGICQAEHTEEAERVGDSSAIPTIKTQLYGFDVLDIGREVGEKIRVELSGTFTSKHIWHGLDLLDDHGAFIPVGTIIFGDSGFSAKIIDVYPLSSGFERSVERNYAGFYTGTVLEDTAWTTRLTTNYFYYGKPKVGNHKSDAQEVGTTFFWPQLVSAGDNPIIPTYYLGYIWASEHDSNIRGCEGFIHVFGLGYDLGVPDFWPGGKQQAFRLFGDITYNDGFAGSTIDHDWSHVLFGISTSLGQGNLTLTPTLNYQISMDDSVNREDELWCSVNATYRF
jgi:hypothetical protein